MVNKVEIIERPNTLIGKVTYGNDGVDAALLEKVDNELTQMAGEYVGWATDDLKKLQTLYDSLEAMPEELRKDAMPELFNVAHDMRGQGGSFGYPLVSSIANLLCNFIEKRQAFGAQEMTAIKLHLDALRMVISARMQGPGGNAGSNLLAGLAGVLNKIQK